MIFIILIAFIHHLIIHTNISTPCTAQMLWFLQIPTACSQRLTLLSVHPEKLNTTQCRLTTEEWARIPSAQSLTILRSCTVRWADWIHKSTNKRRRDVLPPINETVIDISEQQTSLYDDVMHNSLMNSWNEYCQNNPNIFDLNPNCYAQSDFLKDNGLYWK